MHLDICNRLIVGGDCANFSLGIFMKRILFVLVTCFVVDHAAAADVFADKKRVAVSRGDAFEHVTGVKEKDYEKLLIGSSKDRFWIQNVVTGREWYAGKFCDPSVEELRAMVEEKVAKEPKHKKAKTEIKKKKNVPGRFNVVVGYSFAPDVLREIEVQALQAKPENRGAVFQVASRFECLEGAGEQLTDYTHNGAQGELAAISALPGTIVRRYALGPINLLRDLEHPAFTLHGRGVVKHLSFQGIDAESLAQAAAFDTDKVRVGVHLDSCVTFGLVDKSNRTHELCKDRHQQVIQIYTSAVDMPYRLRALYSNGQMRQIEAIAARMLMSSYEGTILAAGVYGEQKTRDDDKRALQQVFLTLMGCGVFRNKLEWVAEAIEYCMDDIIKLGLDVTLVVFNGNDYPDTMPEFLNSMNEFVEATGGTYTEVR